MDSFREKVMLSVAGTDPLAGAGCAADLATFRAFGWAGCSVETAWVAQNSMGVETFVPSETLIFAQRLSAVFHDCDVAGIKVGMLASRPLIEVLAQFLTTLKDPPPLVLDPVGAAGGATASALYQGDFANAFDVLFPFVTLITPNQKELHALTGVLAHTHAEAEHAAQRLHARGVDAVLLKGGHLEPRGVDRISLANDAVYDVYRGQPWSVDIHGTGCHLSSAIACGLAEGLSLLESSERAARWLHALVRHGAYHRLGRGRPQFDARKLYKGFES